MRYLRLKKNTHFQKLFKRGKRVFSPHITLLYAPSPVPVMGIALSKKHGKAVRRNRLKRVLRAAYAESLNCLATTCSVVILPKPGEDISYAVAKRELLSCFKRIDAGMGK